MQHGVLKHQYLTQVGPLLFLDLWPTFFFINYSLYKEGEREFEL